jgi:hypothetical protein
MGEKIPEPEGDGSSWLINDGAYGLYIVGHSKESVLARWKQAVYGYALRELIQTHNYRTVPSDEIYGCPRCGCAVIEEFLFKHSDECREN